MTNQYFVLKYAVLIIFLIKLFSCPSNSQTFTNFGIKAGCLITGLGTSNVNEPVTSDIPKPYVSDSSFPFSYFSYDIGVFAEWLNSEKFCISTELHYTVKAENKTSQYIVPNVVYIPGGNYWERGYLKDKAQYLSFQILPRYRLVVTPDKKDNIFIYAGPSFDILLKDESFYSQPNYIKAGGFIRCIGGVLGFGFEWKKILAFEIRVDHNFKGPYKFVYENDEIARRYTTITFLTGIALNKF